MEFARIEQQREISIRRAAERVTVSKEEAESLRLTQISQIVAQEQVRETELNEQKKIELVRIATEQETRLQDIARAKLVQLEQFDRDLAIIAKSQTVYEAKIKEEDARARAAKAEEDVSTTREAAVAERRKQIEIIAADGQAQSSAIKLTTMAEAEAQVAEHHKRAEELAALAAQIRYEIDAAGKQKLNEAENMRSEASRGSELRMQLARNIDAIIRESVRPMENIDTIKIVEVNGLPGFSQGGGSGGGGGGGGSGGELPRGGDGNLAESVVNSALRYRAQMPFLDALLKEIGMSAGEISNIRNILGDLNKPSGANPQEQPS